MIIKEDVHSAEPFFMLAAPGQRFCIYYPSKIKKQCLAAVIYIHPFAEEMNKSRRMIALQARTLADLGYAVLQLDLLGCGDSSGDFSDARWEIWKADLAVAEKWLTEKTAAPIYLWGLRLGATLALEYASTLNNNIRQLILWQPIINTRNYVTQFFRLRLANEMIAESSAKKNSGTNGLRAELANGNPVEIAGYELAPALVNVIENINVDNLHVKQCPVHWFEIVPESRASLPPSALGVIDSWKNNGVDLTLHLVHGVSFWSTQEVTDNRELLSKMTDLFSLKIR